MSHNKFEEILPYEYPVTATGLPTAAEITQQIRNDFKNYRIELVQRVADAIAVASGKNCSAGDVVVVDFEDRNSKAKIGERPLKTEVKYKRLSLVG